MNSIIIRSWNNKTIRQREDGYLSATDMCQACGKLFGHWNELSSTKDYLKALQTKHYRNHDNAQLVESKTGGTPQTTGTWVHRKVALRLAQWLSPEFAVQVDEWIEELLLTGKVELEKPLVLPPADVRVSSLVTSLEKLGIEIDNPRIKQGLQDLTLDILGIGQPRIAGSQEIWLGVAERAEQLGYSTSLIVKNRTQLGKYVKACGLQPKSEERLCNGTQRPINIYKLCDELDAAIREFMDAKVLAA